MKKTKIITFSALMAALSIAFLLLGSFLDVFDFTVVILSALLVLLAWEEMRYASLGVYAVTLTIALLLLPNKLIGVEYAILGIYPVLKFFFDKAKKPFNFILKYAYGALAIAGIVVLSKFVFTPDMPDYMVWLLSLGGVLIFVLFDILLFRFIMYYRFKLRHQLRLDKFFY